MWGTTSNFPSINSYEDAKRKYENTKPLRGRPDFRPLEARSSRAKAQILKSGENYVIRLYNTDIITYKSTDEIILYTGGWNSATTAVAISSMSPFACWMHEGNTIVRMPDLKRCYWLSHTGTGLTIKDGQPVNPVMASITKTRVRKAEAKAARKYFAEVPKLIESLSALLDGKPKPAHDHSGVLRCFESGEPLQHEDIANMALGVLRLVWAIGGYVVDGDSKKSIARFWRDVYLQLGLIETYHVELPLGEV